MNSEQDLINRLMISKKIMEKSDQIGRGQAKNTISAPIVEEFQPITVITIYLKNFYRNLNHKKNIIQRFLQKIE